MAIQLTPPLAPEDVKPLRAGGRVSITGVMYTARDAAHRKLVELIDSGRELPLDLNGQVIYYVGPTPASPGRATGSAGPTTASRMDVYTPRILARGVRALIGKGDRSAEVAAALKENDAVYLAAVGGAGALLAEYILATEPVAWPELGPEAIYRLEVRDFPAIVVIDTEGGNLYETGRARYRKT